MGNASVPGWAPPPPQGPKHCRVPTGTRGHSTCISCRASSSESLSAKTCSLFLPNYVQDKYLFWLQEALTSAPGLPPRDRGQPHLQGRCLRLQPQHRVPGCLWWGHLPGRAPLLGVQASKLKPLEQASTRGTQAGPCGSPASTPDPWPSPKAHQHTQSSPVFPLSGTIFQLQRFV